MNVELKDFIVSTVSNIEGALMEIKSTKGIDYVLGRQNNTTQYDSKGGVIDFDLIVEASEKAGVNGGAKLSVLNVISLGGDGIKANELSQTNHIKFSIRKAYERNDIGGVVNPSTIPNYHHNY